MKLFCLMSFLIAGSVIGCGGPDVVLDMSVSQAGDALHEYFMAKHPDYAAIHNDQAQDLPGGNKELNDLITKNPVQAVVHSFPHGPSMTYTEFTEYSEDEMLAVQLNIHSTKDGKCLIKSKIKRLRKQPMTGYAKTDPVTIDDLRNLKPLEKE